MREKIRDNRLIRLISGLLEAGYLENWKYNATYSGVPQGGVVSPILANLVLDRLDKYVERELIPAYTRGKRRRTNPPYVALTFAGQCPYDGTNGLHSMMRKVIAKSGANVAR